MPINPTISIHALRKESDSSKATTSKPSSEFQSTLSVRRATGQATGLDTMTVFQSTLSVRRATVHDAAAKSFQSISIHALRKESDGRALLPGNVIPISIHALRKESDHHAT